MPARPLPLALVAGVLAALPSVALGAGKTLTVDEAVEMALRTNPSLLAAESAIHGDRDLERSAGARMLPSVRVTDEYDHWDSPFSIVFGPQAITARRQDTNTFTATAHQPLLRLLRLSHQRSAPERSADASETAFAAL